MAATGPPITHDLPTVCGHTPPTERRGLCVLPGGLSKPVIMVGVMLVTFQAWS